MNPQARAQNNESPKPNEALLERFRAVGQEGAGSQDFPWALWV